MTLAVDVSTDDEYHMHTLLMTLEMSMLQRVLIGILIVLAVGEGVYIALNRRTINRFKPVDQDGYVAFDTATGQLCRSYRTKVAEKIVKPASKSSLPSQSQAGPEDPILAAIQKGPPNAQADEKAGVEFIRALPACADLH